VLAAARAGGGSLAEAVVTAGVVDASDLATLSARAAVPTAEHAVDVVTARVAGRLDATSETWP
jgi:hypothetical protein